MDKYSLVLQILAILFVCFLLYLLYKFLIALYKERRIASFSLDLYNDNTDRTILFKFIFGFSRFLKSLVLFNDVAKTYDKYVYGDSRLKNGMDYISIKILMGFGLVLLSIVISLMFRGLINLWILFSIFVLGFVIPDFYCIFVKTKRVKIFNRNLLGAIIIMNNCYKANGSSENAINEVINRTDGVVSLEFKKVLNDINLGMDIGDAFYRMYLRTKLDLVLDISKMLKISSKCGLNVASAFNSIEEKLINEERFNNEINYLVGINKFALVLFILLPLVFIVSFVLYNPLYLDVFFSSIGVVVFTIIFIIYVFYIIVLYKIFKGDYYGK